MSDLQTLTHPTELLAALRTGVLERATVGALELPPARLGGVELRQVRLEATRLLGLEIQALQARQVLARGALLRAVRWPQAVLEQWHAHGCQAQEMQLPGARILDSSWTETPITNSSFRDSQWLNTRLAQCDANHVVLAGSILVACQFTDERHGGAILDNADLRGAVLCNVQLRGANLLRARLDGAILVGVDLRDANLRDATWQDALFFGCQLERSGIQPAAADRARVLAAMSRLPEAQARALAGLLLAAQSMPAADHDTPAAPPPAPVASSRAPAAPQPQQGPQSLPAQQPAAAAAPPAGGLEID